MNTENFLAAMSNDLTIQELEDCGVIAFIKTGIIDEDKRPLVDTLSKIIVNLNIMCSKKIIKDANFGICMNYSKVFLKNDHRNYDFYSLNCYLDKAIGSCTAYPIPSGSGGYWEGENLKNRIIYMKWIIRQLKTLKSHLGIE
jgi:hypothetical protein